MCACVCVTVLDFFILFTNFALQEILCFLKIFNREVADFL